MNIVSTLNLNKLGVYEAMPMISELSSADLRNAFCKEYGLPRPKEHGTLLS